MGGGIYQIINLINSKKYVGSAVNFRKRFLEHKNHLIKKTHHNYHLQKSWDKYGSQNFKFEILEYVNKNDLLKREQYYINLYKSCNSDNGYNINPIAGSNLGRKFGPPSKETRIKYSKARMGKPSPAKGMIRTNKSNLKTSESCGSKPFKVWKSIIIKKGNRNGPGIYKKGKFIGEWINQSECARNLNINGVNINYCLNKKFESLGGYIFEYKK